MATQRVAVIGGGIGGLATALALPQASYKITIIERDPAPPSIDPSAAFEAWDRPGVPQFRHAHIMLARLQTSVRDNHPALLQQLFDAGLYLSTIEEILPPSRYRGVTPQADDGDLLHLWGRRATFEYVVRRYVGQLPHVEFLHDTRVLGLAHRRDGRDTIVSGVEVVGPDRERRTLEADIVVDASGAHGKTLDWLRTLGAEVKVDSQPSGFVYSCRHYRLNDPSTSPPRAYGGGNLDYLGYATFYAEHGHYALTLCCPEQDSELVALVSRPDGFESVCSQLPTLADWTRISTPTTKVLGAGRFENRWRSFAANGGQRVLGLFLLGDALLQTNPMYGRGCASAFVQAGVLADALREHSDARKRAERYYARSRALLQPYFELSVATDRLYRMRARARDGEALTPQEGLINYAYEHAFMPATYRYPLLAREFLRSVQMREISSPWVRLTAVWLLIAAWIAGRFRPAAAPEPIPPRTDFVRGAHGRMPKAKTSVRPKPQLEVRASDVE